MPLFTCKNLEKCLKAGPYELEATKVIYCFVNLILYNTSFSDDQNLFTL